MKLKILIFCKITIKYKNRAAIAIKNRQIISLDPLSKSMGAATKKRNSNSKSKILLRKLKKEVNSRSNEENEQEDGQVEQEVDPFDDQGEKQGQSVTHAIGELIE